MMWVAGLLILDAAVFAGLWFRPAPRRFVDAVRKGVGL